MMMRFRFPVGGDTIAVNLGIFSASYLHMAQIKAYIIVI